MRIRAAHPAFTLVEMIVTLAIMSILVTTMASAVVIASRAIPVDDELSRQIQQGAEALDQLAIDLAEAHQFSTRSERSFNILVPDRGQGDEGDESLLYSWAGKVGDPLLVEVNGAAPVELCPNVHAFTVEYAYAERAATSPPRVMLIVASDTSPSDNDRDRMDLLTSWGFSYELFNDDTPLADLQAGEDRADVIYISDSARNNSIGGKIRYLTLPIVNEANFTSAWMGITTGTWGWFYDDIDITDNTHPITQGLDLGEIKVCDYVTALNFNSGTLAPGAQVLATTTGGASLVVVETGEELVWGADSLAPARLVMMPWGGDSLYDFDAHNDVAHALIRRALLWASTPKAVSSVRITLQVGADPQDAITRTVQVLNEPGA